MSANGTVDCTHGSGIPCVTGVEDGMNPLHSDDGLTIDGRLGIVRVEDEACGSRRRR